MSNLQDPISRRTLLAGASAGLALSAFQRKAPGAEPQAPSGSPAPDPTQGWSQTSPRPELRPEFSLDPQGGPDHHPCLLIRSDARDGLDGAWTKTFPVAGGKHYHFSALYRAAGVSIPRRSIVAKLDWRDALGRSIP